MLGFIVVCIALAISAAYEVVEWGAALALGQGATEFLATQGDPWDTQSDMFFALVGADSVGPGATTEPARHNRKAKFGVPPAFVQTGAHRSEVFRATP